MDVDGGAVKTLTSQSAVPIGGTWNRDGIILFADNPGGPILSVSANGGEQTAVTRLQTPQQRGHHFPQFLPHGRRFLFFVSGSPEGAASTSASSARLTPKRLLAADTAAAFAASGHLLFIRNSKLYAQPFDADRGETSGDAFVVEDDRVNSGTITFHVRRRTHRPSNASA